ncbi:heparinase II/III family protein [Pelagibacterium sp.]|uniref:heparinase II/III family protein n=1 Tax=Pelagibacterium sp. TaxID=1967288 RepID=UPI003A927AC6
MTSRLSKIRTVLALGPTNVLAVVLYRLALRNPGSAIRRLVAPVPQGPFFAPSAPAGAPAPASTDWHDKATYFGHQQVDLGASPPDWFTNPFNGARVAEPQRPWWTISDFDGRLGDIKAVWEASRLDWAPIFAQRARAGDATALARLEAWLADWIASNRPYTGPNWKCGQEASIRVIHLALTALLLGGPKSVGPSLAPLLRLHLERIAPTTGYARAQDNNHGTSEAAALLIGGTWITRLGDGAGAGYARTGRRMLEERVLALVETDGSFSQYSTNYHRLLLDTLSFAEVWRRRLDLTEFTSAFCERAAAAAAWLRLMVSAENGDAANIGANDGARLLPLGTTPYRDFRPSVQLAHILFADQQAYAGSGEANQYADWLGIPPSAALAVPVASQLLDKGGYGVLVAGTAKAILRYPRFRYRPGHADALHLDFWIGGLNLLRDGGTYTYNAPNDVLDRYSGTQGHNTIQFDGRNQMPRIGRFLFADWLSAEDVAFDAPAQSMTAAYRDAHGARHARRVDLAKANRLAVTDSVSGPFSAGCLRWRLAPGAWELTADGASSALGTIHIAGDMPVTLSLAAGTESRHYLAHSPLPVLEARFSRAGTVVTEVSWTL